jgi:transposase-like protein
MSLERLEAALDGLGGHEEGLKGGRQRGKKALVGVAIEVRGQGSGRLRLAVLPDASGPALLAFTQATTAPGAIVHTDGLQSYKTLAKHGYDHRRQTQTAAVPGEQLLPRTHRAISNLKAWMDGTHRGVSDQHLPVYLDEYVFRHNRRASPRWPRSRPSSGSALLTRPPTYGQITRQTAA